MKQIALRKIFALILITGSLAVVPAYGQSGDSWEYSGAINLWGAGIKGTTQGGTKIDIGFSDIWDNLDMTFQGTLEGRKGKWSWLTDVIYLSVSTNKGSNVSTPGGAVPAKVNVGVDSWAWNLLAGYNLSDNESGRNDVVFGARYLDLDTTVNLALGVAGVRVSRSGSVWDGVVGIRGRANLEGNWYLPYYADIGTGNSDLTWQVLGGFGYKYSWGDMTFAYRHLEWEFDTDAPLEDVSYSGPIIQAKWYF